MTETNSSNPSLSTSNPTQNTEQNKEFKMIENTEMNALINNLHTVRDFVGELGSQVAELEAKLSLARGTGDQTAKAAAAQELDTLMPAMPRTKTQPGVHRTRGPASHSARIEAMLAGFTLSPKQIAKETQLPLTKVEKALQDLKHENRVWNVGSEEFPRWTRRIGDDTDTRTLTNEVRRLITERPMTMPELHATTGARISRISGALTLIGRTEGSRMLNLGTPRRARWLYLDPATKGSQVSVKPHGPAF